MQKSTAKEESGQKKRFNASLRFDVEILLVLMVSESQYLGRTDFGKKAKARSFGNPYTAFRRITSRDGASILSYDLATMSSFLPIENFFLTGMGATRQTQLCS